MVEQLILHLVVVSLNYKYMNVKIKLLKDVVFAENTMYELSFKKGETFVSNEPEQGLNEDGTFSICGGMSIYHSLKKEYFKIIDTY